LKPLRLVITGGPATGKTAIIEHLETLKYHCYEEVIRKLTMAAQEKGDITESHSNPIALVSDSLNFNTTLINLRIDDYKHADQINKKPVFYDRGIPDVLAYMDYFKQDIPDNFKTICQEHTYDHVFLLPPWEAIYKDDGERFETFKEATHIYHHLKDTYTRFGHHITEIPFGTIQDRTNYILNCI